MSVCRTTVRRTILAIAASMALGCAADDTLVRLVSLDWQPYASAALPEQGAAAAVVKAALQAVGYSVDIDFYPWARAVHLTESANEYDGIFPVYYSAARARWLNCSSSIGRSLYARSPLGFAERSKAPVAWTTLDDLRAYKVGVVRDYVNTESFDSMVAAGHIAVDVASSDTQNLQKLAHGRIDLAIIDRNVMEQLLKGPAFLSVVGTGAGGPAIQPSRAREPGALHLLQAQRRRRSRQRGVRCRPAQDRRRGHQRPLSARIGEPACGVGADQTLSPIAWRISRRLRGALRSTHCSGCAAAAAAGWWRRTDA
jgi:polar amino acid transport system substrate-binding protein